MASSLTEATVGMIITPMMSPAEMALNDPMLGNTLSLKSGVMNVRAKYPYTTVGTPARISSAGLNHRRKRIGAYSLRQMAVSSPTGSATLMAIRVAISVPYTSGRTPKSPCGGAHFVEVKNSTGETSRKKREVSSKSTITIPNVVKIDRYAQAVRKTFMMRSLASLVRLLRFQASAPDLVPSVLIAKENPPKSSDYEYRSRLGSRPPYVTSRPVPAQTVTETARVPSSGRRPSARYPC